MIEADTWRCRAAFMDDQAVHIVGAVGQGWLGRAPLSHGPETSFPSDHATFLWSLGFGLLMTRPLCLPGGAIACLGSSVAWARVYLGVHFPLDMAASLVIAACAALVARGLSSRLDGNLFSTVERMNTHILNIVARRKNAGDVG